MMSAQLEEQLQAWARDTRGATVARLRPLDGHSGFTFGFDLVDVEDGPERMVLRLPPPGARSRNADVLRQVPVLRYLAAASFPVAPVLEPGTDETWFGSPYLMVEHVPGRTVSLDRADQRPPAHDHVVAAVAALGRLHRLPAARELDGWSEPIDYKQEVLAWDRALERMPDEWRSDAERLRDRLLAEVPDRVAIGLVHGDYQFSNLLFEGTTLTAVLDWEVCGLGPQLLDLGWFLTINDQASWAHPVATEAIPSEEEIVTCYASAVGREVQRADVAFVRAVASYRFAVIAGLNLRLHRTGRREDPHWEMIAPSIPRLVADGLRRLEDHPTGVAS